MVSYYVCSTLYLQTFWPIVYNMQSIRFCNGVIGIYRHVVSMILSRAARIFVLPRIESI